MKGINIGFHLNHCVWASIGGKAACAQLAGLCSSHTLYATASMLKATQAMFESLLYFKLHSGSYCNNVVHSNITIDCTEVADFTDLLAFSSLTRFICAAAGATHIIAH